MNRQPVRCIILRMVAQPTVRTLLRNLRLRRRYHLLLPQGQILLSTRHLALVYRTCLGAPRCWRRCWQCMGSKTKQTRRQHLPQRHLNHLVHHRSHLRMMMTTITGDTFGSEAGPRPPLFHTTLVRSLVRPGLNTSIAAGHKDPLPIVLQRSGQASLVRSHALSRTCTTTVPSRPAQVRACLVR